MPSSAGGAVRLYELWDAVDALLPAGERHGPSSTWTGRRLAELLNVPMACLHSVEELGLPAVVVFCADSISSRGDSDAHPELMALATCLLSAPVTDAWGHDMWPGGVSEATGLLAILRASTPAQG